MYVIINYKCTPNTLYNFSRNFDSEGEGLYLGPLGGNLPLDHLRYFNYVINRHLFRSIKRQLNRGPKINIQREGYKDRQTQSQIQSHIWRQKTMSLRKKYILLTPVPKTCRCKDRQTYRQTYVNKDIKIERIKSS